MNNAIITTINSDINSTAHQYSYTQQQSHTQTQQQLGNVSYRQTDATGTFHNPVTFTLQLSTSCHCMSSAHNA